MATVVSPYPCEFPPVSPLVVDEVELEDEDDDEVDEEEDKSREWPFSDEVV